MEADRARRQRDDGIESHASLVEERLRLPLRHNPTVDIARRARIQSLQYFAHWIALVEFQSHLGTECPDALRHAASPTFRQNEAKAGNGSAPARLTGALQPQQRKRQAGFDGVRGLAVRDAQHGPSRRASAKNASRVVSREGMLEVG